MRLSRLLAPAALVVGALPAAAQTIRRVSPRHCGAPATLCDYTFTITSAPTADPTRFDIRLRMRVNAPYGIFGAIQLYIRGQDYPDIEGGTPELTPYGAAVRLVDPIDPTPAAVWFADPDNGGGLYFGNGSAPVLGCGNWFYDDPDDGIPPRPYYPGAVQTCAPQTVAASAELRFTAIGWTAADVEGFSATPEPAPSAALLVGLVPLAYITRRRIVHR